VNRPDNHGATALLTAAGNGRTAAVTVLISAKANLNSKTLSGRTPLHEAAGNSHVRICEVSLLHRASTNAQTTPSGWAALHGAVASGNEDTVKGSCTKRSGLTQPNIRGGDAIACGHIRQAWCHCPDCRRDTTVDRHLWRYAASRCLLSKRRLGNSYDIFLWSGTCHPPWKTGLGIHPLYSAAMFGNTAEAQLLLDHGADV